MKKRPDHPTRVSIVPDGDRMGLFLGVLSATAVLAASFFNELPLIQVATRMASTFLIVYGVAFVVTRVLMAIAEPEIGMDVKKNTETSPEEVEGQE